MMSNAIKSFDILAANLSILHGYFGITKLFLDIYVTKFLDILAKFFPCMSKFI